MVDPKETTFVEQDVVGPSDYNPSQSGDVSVVSNHTGYPHSNSHDWEHDDTGAQSNYSGVADEFDNAQAEHEGWTPGYDY